MTVQILSATPEHEAAWRDLWAQYLAYYKVDLPDEVTAKTWARLMDPQSPMNARLASLNGEIVGFAIHHHHCSSWVIGDDCYLEDLFVSPTARKQGVARALIDDLQSLARARGWHRLYWHTDEANKTARSLYDSFTPSDGHIRYRLKL
ncbi:MAG: family N-acetyltransferase [Cypionkella sp.]|uniref:GNAT family N-acetyltransferase n=1 Tax=Cypionkella sp. TaxID=2811411 RepID=UPI00261476AE|nr:GNAT family N-acetyltransferase [Cypionkella sp.]MDB5661408.1 family N-acetyltransferase [Cypionkella sp.]